MFYCRGSSYHTNILVDGKLQIKKNTPCREYIDKPNEKMDLGNLYKKKIGLKQ